MKLNLLPKGERPIPKTRIRPGFILALLTVLIIAAAAGVTVLKMVERDNVRSELASARQARIALEAQKHEVDAIEAKIAAVEAERKVWQDLQDQAASGVQIDHVQQVIGLADRQLWFEEVRGSGSVVHIMGYTRDVAVLSRYLHDLGRAGYGVRLDALQVQRSLNLYTFQLRVERGGRT